MWYKVWPAHKHCTGKQLGKEAKLPVPSVHQWRQSRQAVPAAPPTPTPSLPARPFRLRVPAAQLARERRGVGVQQKLVGQLLLVLGPERDRPAAGPAEGQADAR